jgi:hypothetical protein
MGWVPSYQTEDHIHASYLLDNHPNGRAAVLYQNDDFRKDYLTMTGLRDGLAGGLYKPLKIGHESRVVNFLRLASASNFSSVSFYYECRKCRGRLLGARGPQSAPSS